MSRISFVKQGKTFLAFLAAMGLAMPVGAVQGSPPKPLYKIGSPNTVSADPPVPHPNTQPCVVTLFQGLEFADFNPKPFNYSPPAQCPAPWAKVVLDVNLTVTAGVQFDRTGNFWIGGTNIFFGTTAEPMSTFGPYWHVERDLTDYSALLTSAQTGQADLGNLVNGTYTGIIYGTAMLKFYPLPAGQAPPRTPDMVYPFSAGPDGGTVTLNTGTDQLAQTLTLPTNIEQAYLDVFAQSQSNDEFWYTCVPDDVSTELQSCPGTAFREAEISIDGTPAGVAPIYPWIYTGGIDPYLWTPLPGVQTLNFKPYRVNLTPFVGMLNDGQPHTIALSVYNADSYFSATATLLIYLDHNSSQDTGAVIANDIPPVNPQVVENINNQGGNITGTVSVNSPRNLKVVGYLDTSHGRVTTTVEQKIHFLNRQTFDITNALYQQDITQDTVVNSLTTVQNRGASNATSETRDYPLRVDIAVNFNSNGGTQATSIQQDLKDNIGVMQKGQNVFSSFTNNGVVTQDTLDFNAAGQITGNQDQQSTQKYYHTASSGLQQCYIRTLTSANGLLTGVTNSCPAR